MFAARSLASRAAVAAPVSAARGALAPCSNLVAQRWYHKNVSEMAKIKRRP
jgi:hypothetical protein